jgi:hypothetical protein
MLPSTFTIRGLSRESVLGVLFMARMVVLLRRISDKLRLRQTFTKPTINSNTVTASSLDFQNRRSERDRLRSNSFEFGGRNLPGHRARVRGKEVWRPE